MPGYSYSGIKNLNGATFKPTKKMQLGTSVHNYLLEPQNYNFENLAIVKPLALAVKQTLGPLFKHLLPELSVTADFVYNDFVLPYKGRIDAGIPDIIVIDLKVTEIDVWQGIRHFGYDRQLSGYATALNAKTAVIVGINPNTAKTQIVKVPICTKWWEKQILQLGVPV